MPTDLPDREPSSGDDPLLLSISFVLLLFFTMVYLVRLIEALTP